MCFSAVKLVEMHLTSRNIESTLQILRGNGRRKITEHRNNGVMNKNEKDQFYYFYLFIYFIYFILF